MKYLKFYFVFIYLLTPLSIQIYSQRVYPVPPKAEKVKKVLTIHGDQRIDNYFWMNERGNPKVIDYLKKENEYTAKVMAHTKNLQNKIYNEIIGRIKKTDVSFPYKKNGYFYYERYEKNKEYPIYCRKKNNLNSKEEVILDVNKQSAGFKLYKVADLFVSPNNKILGFAVDTAGDRVYTIFFKDLTTGKLLDFKIPGTGGDLIWANDNKTVFYDLNDETIRNYKILKYILGEPIENAKTILEEHDVKFEFYMSRSRSNKYLYIESYSKTSNEFRFLSADNPNGEFKIIQPRTKNLLYDVQDLGNKFYIKTNYNAENFKIVTTNIDDPSIENWKDFLPYLKNILTEKFVLFNNFLVTEEKINGLSQIRIINLKDKSEHYIDFGEKTYSAGLEDNPEMNTQKLRYEFTSLTTPSSIYEYNMQTKEKKLLKHDEVLGNYNPGDYESKRLFATANDGTKIPISIVYKRGLKKDGNNPVLLYAYGSYGNSRRDEFSSDRISLLDRGFIFAIAHVRGGEEMGRYWYEDGKLLKKMNTFTDFINCAEFLINEKYTNPQKLCATGKSAGGMLMAGVANMRPDLFKAIVAEVPWTDVVTDNLDSTLPLTTVEYEEWGNANKKNYYDYMLKYSPYDNVKAQNYPAILTTAAYNDTQVPYWSPAKWVAKLRDFKKNNNVVLMQTNMSSGHSGASGRFEKYKLTALEYAFILDQVGIKN